MAEYDKHYGPTLWKDFPLTDTSINAYRLNHLETGVNENDNRIVILSEDKLEKSAARKFVTGWKLDTETWIATTTYADGTVEAVDFPIEMMPTRIDLDDDNNLVLVQQDGTVKKINFERFAYTVENTATIAMRIEGTTIFAQVREGSITLNDLEPTLLTTIRQYMLDAQTAKGQAEKAEVDAAGAAKQAKTEAERAKAEADRASQYSQIVAPGFYFDVDSATLYEKAGVGVDFLLDGARLYWKITT